MGSAASGRGMLGSLVAVIAMRRVDVDVILVQNSAATVNATQHQRQPLRREGDLLTVPSAITFELGLG